MTRQDDRLARAVGRLTTSFDALRANAPADLAPLVDEALRASLEYAQIRSRLSFVAGAKARFLMKAGTTPGPEEERTWLDQPT